MKTDSNVSSEYEGHHESTPFDVISGWAYKVAAPDQPLELEILADDISLGIVRADKFREDVKDAGKGNGYHAFSYIVPFWLRDGKPHSIRVRVAGDNVDLTGTPRQIVAETQALSEIRNLIAGIEHKQSRVCSQLEGRPLAIFAPSVGALTETFIRRHMQDILPDGTVVLADSIAESNEGQWSVDCPTLILQRTSLNNAMTDARRFLIEHKVYVLMAEYLDEALRWISTAKELGIKFFAHAHGYDVSQTLKDDRWKQEYLRLNEADGIITMSEASRRRLLNLGLSGDKVKVVPYGVTVPPKLVHRTDCDVVRCLAVSRMVAKKGPIYTLDAFRRAREACPELRLDYVGGGALLPAARQFARAFELEKFVTFHGGQPSEIVGRLMAEADLFIQHSITDPETGDEEGLPVAILEAMAQGLPIVSTFHGGIPEAVENNVTGFLVQEGDTVSMAERIIALSQNMQLRKQFGAAAWDQARRKFSWERERAQLLRILGLIPRLK